MEERVNQLEKEDLDEDYAVPVYKFSTNARAFDWRCGVCKRQHIVAGFKFCPDCGCEINWKPEQMKNMR